MKLTYKTLFALLKILFTVLKKMIEGKINNDL